MSTTRPALEDMVHRAEADLVSVKVERIRKYMFSSCFVSPAGRETPAVIKRVVRSSFT